MEAEGMRYCRMVVYRLNYLQRSGSVIAIVMVSWMVARMIEMMAIDVRTVRVCEMPSLSRLSSCSSYASHWHVTMVRARMIDSMARVVAIRPQRMTRMRTLMRRSFDLYVMTALMKMSPHPMATSVAMVQRSSVSARE